MKRESCDGKNLKGREKRCFRASCALDATILEICGGSDFPTGPGLDSLGIFIGP